MKFYNREGELALLRKADQLKAKRSIMTLLLGRRRVGKTTLALQKYSDDAVVYLFVSKKDEHLLCDEFVDIIASRLDVKIFGTFKQFEELFAYLMDLGKTHAFTLIIDEFQELGKINPSIYSSIQKYWDAYKNKTHIHFVASGSIYSLMKKAFEDKKEPLFGRADFKIDLQPLGVSVLKTILDDFDRYTPKNLLDFYTITGGMPKYIELFALHDAFELDQMIDVMIEPNSLFLQEGKNRLIEEFSKEYGTYFSVLSLIASSKTSKSEIESILEKNISGHLARLEKDYNIIRAVKPIGSKPNTKVQKYEIIDHFLSFWFRFIFKYQSLIEANNFSGLKAIIRRDFSAYKGRFLERLFVELLKQKQAYTMIGSYWERGNQNEIDIVAIDDMSKRIMFCEVKLNPKKLNQNMLIVKSQKLLQKYCDYEPEYRMLSVEDIDTFDI
jgi:AAA+ ATPase superfamily predicted ATPase